MRAILRSLLSLSVLFPAAALGQTVGPDAYGYTGTTTAFDFVPLAAVGTPSAVGDDGEFDVTLPWAFPFYGTGYTTARVGGNGGVRFNGGDVTFSNACLPSTGTGAPDIAILWDDLNANSAGDVYTYHDTAVDRFIISWEGVPRYNAIGDSSFQIQLFPAGAIEFHYDDVDFGNATYNGGASATVGIQDHVGATTGAGNVLQWSCNTNTIVDDTAIVFSSCLDADGDGVGGAPCGTDCDDANAAAYPGAVEVCDGFDTDCDGSPLIDGEVDADLDLSLSCADCDDNDPGRQPGGIEVCGDGIDQDCTGLDSVNDFDADTYLNVECGGDDCNDFDAALSPGIDADFDLSSNCDDCDDADPLSSPLSLEICDGIDNDCDGAVVGEDDLDLDGSYTCDVNPDCDDNNQLALPGGVEACDGFDNDCDTVIDQIDLDVDGFDLCLDDCDDADASVYPGAFEVCDAMDNNCDGDATGADLTTGVSAVTGNFPGSSGVPLLDPGTVTDTVTISAPGLSVLSAQVNVQITHTWNNDLDIFLISPSGTRIELSTDNGGLGDNYDATFSDSATNLPPTSNTAIIGEFRPEQPLSDLVGETADGLWTIEITDDTSSDTGTLVAWSIDLTAGSPDDADGDLWADNCGDCDATDAAIAPNQVEVCDGLDNDCDLVLLDGVEADQDFDTALSCNDCDDADSSTYPGAPEICDAVDNDCDGDATGTDPDLGTDTDGDTWADTCGDCDAAVATVYPGAPEICDDIIDQDCDGADLPADGDADGDLAPACGGGDCDASNALIFTGAQEQCDSIDSDCDGLADALDANIGAVSLGAISSPAAPALLIADNATAEDMMVVTAPGAAVEAVTVTVNITHTWVGDLVLTLVSPDGTEVMLVEERGGSGDDFVDVVFDDAAGASIASISSAMAPFTGSWRPEVPLSTLVGRSADGFWILRVQDIATGDTGTLDNWTLDLSTQTLTDTDGDGFVGSCGDCDDTDALIFPGAPEIECDGVDNDCDGADAGAADADGDGFACADDCNDADAAISPAALEICNDGIDNDCEPISADVGDGDGDGAACGADCDDVDANIAPGLPELFCDSVDNDCDVGTDDVGDGDADGALCSDDCDDTNALVLPGSAEIACNAIDDDCDVATDGEADNDGDLAGCGSDCDDTDATIAPGAPELCNDTIDNDCDALTLDIFDADGDGSDCTLDCDDEDAGRAPGLAEVCGDSIDQNCDGAADEAADFAPTLGDTDSATVDLCVTEFPFCGTTWTELQVHADGRVTFGAPRLANLASVSNLESQTPGIAVLWSDLDPSLAGTVTVVEDEGAGSIAVEWTEVALGGAAGSLNSASLVLFEDGMAEVTHGGVAATDVVVGWACEVGADVVDLSALASDVIGQGTESGVAEAFDALGTPYDLSGSTLTFCMTAGVDNDGDGYTDLCGDCDDDLDSVSPLGTEFCNGADDDCNGDVDDADQDGDGAIAQGCGGDDCDDGDAAVHPGAEEICNGEDADCDGNSADQDKDQDGFFAEICGGDDCDDSEALVFPGGVEVCDGADNDCNTVVDDGFTSDADGDGHRAPDCGGADCDDADESAFPGAEELCGDNVDNDCDGGTDDVDADNDGALSLACGGGDCDDTNAEVGPSEAEVAYDGLDNDCTGGDVVDVDGDGFASDQVVDGTDCDDDDAAINLNAAEVCDDAIDNNCDELIDADDTTCAEETTGCTCDSASRGGGAPAGGLMIFAVVAALRRRRQA